MPPPQPNGCTLRTHCKPWARANMHVYFLILMLTFLIPIIILEIQKHSVLEILWDFSLITRKVSPVQSSFLVFAVHNCTNNFLYALNCIASLQKILYCAGKNRLLMLIVETPSLSQV